MKKLLHITVILILFPCASYSQNWFQINSGTNNHLNDIQFVNSTTGFITGFSGTILKTTNGGRSWIQKISGTTYDLAAVHFINEQTGFVTGSNINFLNTVVLLKTTNSGETWNVIPVFSWYDLVAIDLYFQNDQSGFVIGDFQGGSGSSGYLCYTSNSGSNWGTYLTGRAQRGLNLVNNSTGFMLASYWDDIGNSDFHILKTSNGGNNWIINYDPDTSYYTSLFFLNSNLGWAAGQRKGSPSFIKTTDGGVNWEAYSPGQSVDFNRMHFINEDTGWGVSYNIKNTTNSGNTWIIERSINGEYFKAVTFKNGIGFCVGNNGLIVANDSAVIQNISILGNTISQNFRLHQNYPNPFNPVTKIKFEIPLSVIGEKSDVKLSIYDLSGKEVRTLVNNELAPGVYEYNFSSTGLGSGVYFYKLQSGDFTETRRMVLIK